MKVKICIKQKIPLILHSLFRPHPIHFWEQIRRDGRVVDCNGLENRRTETYRGFESLSLRKMYLFSISYKVYPQIHPQKQGDGKKQ